MNQLTSDHLNISKSCNNFENLEGVAQKLGLLAYFTNRQLFCSTFGISGIYTFAFMAKINTNITKP